MELTRRGTVLSGFVFGGTILRGGSSSMSKRIEYIDIARGIGILLVVMGHNDFGVVSPFAYKVIYSFHMPLFFFLSGYFINPGIDFRSFFVKRFNSLLKPYFFTIFLIYFMSISFGRIGFETAIGRIIKSLYGAGYYLDWVQLWFLPHLFVVSLYAFFFYAVVSKIDSRLVRWVILLVTLFLASLFLKTFYPFQISVLGKDYELFGLPFSLDLVLLSGFFFILGSETRHITSEGLFGNPFFFLLTGAAVVFLNLFFPQRVDFNTRLYESFIVNTIGAVAGILFILALSRQIELRSTRLASLFKYFGRMSLILLILHVPIQDFWGQKILGVTGNPPLSVWLAFVAGVAGPVLLHELFIRANPVASFWFGREAELPRQEKQPLPESAAAMEVQEGEKITVR
jgi:polysaccharide biosynthesis protein PslL